MSATKDFGGYLGLFIVSLSKFLYGGKVI